MQTNFSNRLVSLEDIPTVEAVEFVPLERAYLRVQRLWWAVLMTLLGVGLLLAFFFIERIQYIWLMGGAGLAYCLLACLYWVGEGLSFRYSGYALREHDLHFRSGWWVRSVHIVPFNRAQHLSIEVGLLERYFGLASLHIYTAGASQADFSLHGITAETAERLKDFIGLQIKTPDEPLETE